VLLVLAQQLGAELDVEIRILQTGDGWPVLKTGAFFALKISRFTVSGHYLHQTNRPIRRISFGVPAAFMPDQSRDQVGRKAILLSMAGDRIAPAQHLGREIIAHPAAGSPVAEDPRPERRSQDKDRCDYEEEGQQHPA
jgi:hypothetical protein